MHLSETIQKPPLMQVRGLAKTYATRGGPFKAGGISAVQDVSFDLESGETLGIVGESGCGKSTLGRLLVRLTMPSEGSIAFNGTELTTLAPNQFRELRKQIQIIFQDPYASLNPRFRVVDIVSEPWKIYPDVVPRNQWTARAAELLERVGLSGSDFNRYPNEFSGGQRQRIGIARALALNPRVIVCDEPVSALDVSVQAQTLNLLKELQKDQNISMIFISHDLSVIRHMSDRIAVMYLGRIVEMGPCDQIYNSPAHPYTKALLSAAPHHRPQARSGRIILKGEVPSPLNPPSGCRFRTRCWKAQAICADLPPELDPASNPNHLCACYFPEIEEAG